MDSTSPIEVVLITGMSGSGKSVALHALEDAHYYCVDNLPPELLSAFIEVEHTNLVSKIGIAMDVRSAASLPLLPAQFAKLREMGVHIKTIFLDATTETLVHRFSETRRKHPLSNNDVIDHQHALTDAIELERDLLADLRQQSHVVDTSLIRSSQLQSYMKALLSAPTKQLTLVFESFGFKRGNPMDADFVFDVRMLPNPFYENVLRPLTGKDAPVADFLRQYPDVLQMQQHIQDFLTQWLPRMTQDHRSYVTVAIGCTGGKHRSVYLVEELSRHFAKDWSTLKRHRELDGHTLASSIS
ncbi:MAG: RNase adapter RapZ [Burkholderiaceae bacterium]